MKKSIQLAGLLLLLFFSACQSNEETLDVAPVFMQQNDSLHYVLVKVKSIPIADQTEEAGSSAAEVQQLRENLSELVKLDEAAKLRVSLIYFEQEENIKEPILVIRRFQNLETANRYRLVLEEKMSSNPQIEAILPIAQVNYRTVLKEKSLAGYQNYFKDQLSSLLQ